ncbi:MAG: hypothetical protein ACI37S_01960 [Candidatus Gastranaerophilaceae bacterium]
MTDEIKETTSQNEQIEDCKTQKNVKNENLKELIEQKLGTQIPEKNQDFRKDVKENLKALDNLLARGFINELQGQNLLNLIIKGALENKGQDSTQVDKAENSLDKISVFKEFDKIYPKFFEQDGRCAVLDYLKSDNIQLDGDELSKISKIVELVENAAIDRYLKKVAYEENLEKSNLQAKQRLLSNIQKANTEDKNSLPYTRSQIGKMSNAEYLENEKLIMEQIKKGLIK